MNLRDYWHVIALQMPTDIAEKISGKKVKAQKQKKKKRRKSLNK